MLFFKKKKIINLDQTGFESLPSHVAVIMDGNGRWAKSQGKSRTSGHKAGAETAAKLVESCIKFKIPYLTLYAFSSENWKRPESEVSELMSIMKFYLENEIDRLHQNNVKVRIIGDLSRIDADLVRQIKLAEEKTKDNSAITVIVALSYGGRQEITSAVKSIAKMAVDGVLEPDSISEESISRLLYTSDIPDPDLLIRTAGELRISNFLLWQAAYSEFYFTNTLWPDFDEAEFIKAIKEYSGRVRKFGAL